ncbi:MAG: hypothetical protein AAF633_12615, partial [Chloroflexota bacterium]
MTPPADDTVLPTATAPRVATPVVEPTPTEISFPQSMDEVDFLTIAIDAPSRNRDFAIIDEYGYLQ